MEMKKDMVINIENTSFSLKEVRKLLILTAIISLIISGVIGYWLGTKNVPPLDKQIITTLENCMPKKTAEEQAKIDKVFKLPAKNESAVIYGNEKGYGY